MDTENSRIIDDNFLESILSNGRDKILPAPKQETHLTHTGPYAGIPYCDVNRNNTDRYIHTNIKYIENHRDIICKKCLDIWDNAI